QNGAQFVKPVIVTMQNYIVRTGVAAMAIPRERGHAVRPQQAHTVCQVILIGHNHTTLASGKILVAEEREAAEIPQRTSRLAMWWPLLRIQVARAHSMAGIFDQNQTMVLAQSTNLSHATEIATIVHNHNCFRTWRDSALNITRIDGRFVQAHDI